MTIVKRLCDVAKKFGTHPLQRRHRWYRRVTSEHLRESPWVYLQRLRFSCLAILLGIITITARAFIFQCETGCVGDRAADFERISGAITYRPNLLLVAPWAYFASRNSNDPPSFSSTRVATSRR